MRKTTNLILALLTSVAIAPSAFAQMNKHDKSIAAYGYNIAIQENDTATSSAPLNADLDKGVISEDTTPAVAAPAMPAPVAGQQAQAPLTPYQDGSLSGAPQALGTSNASKPVAVPAQAIQVGAVAPDFILPKTSGEAVGLKDVLAKGPAVILFTRGSACAFCVTQMQLLQKNQQQFAALGIQTLAVSPEPLDSLTRSQQRFGIAYPLLSDANSQVAKSFGLVTPTGAAPALVTIDASGKVVDVQIQEQGSSVFNLTKATNPLRSQAAAVAPVVVPTSPATKVPSTQVAPPSAQPTAMPPVPSPKAGKVKFDVPPSNPNFGKVDETKSIAI